MLPEPKTPLTVSTATPASTFKGATSSESLEASPVVVGAKPVSSQKPMELDDFLPHPPPPAPKEPSESQDDDVKMVEPAEEACHAGLEQVP